MEADIIAPYSRAPDDGFKGISGGNPAALKYKQMAIHNIVSTGNFGFKFVLALLNMFMKSTLVRKTRFPALDMYVKHGKLVTNGLLFATSHITALGARSTEEARFRTQLHRTYVERAITDNYTDYEWIWNPADKTICQLLMPKIRNVVVTASFYHGIDIGRFKNAYPFNTQYEVDSFSGAIYTPNNVTCKSNIRAMLFLSGKVVVVGAPSITAAAQVLVELARLLVGFEKAVIDVRANARFVSEYETFLGRSNTENETGVDSILGGQSRLVDEVTAEIEYELLRKEVDELAQ